MTKLFLQSDAQDRSRPPFTRFFPSQAGLVREIQVSEMTQMWICLRHVRHPLYTVIASPVTNSQSQLDGHSDSWANFTIQEKFTLESSCSLTSYKYFHLRAVNVKSLLFLEMLDPALPSQAARGTIRVGTTELLKHKNLFLKMAAVKCWRKSLQNAGAKGSQKISLIGKRIDSGQAFFQLQDGTD